MRPGRTLRLSSFAVTAQRRQGHGGAGAWAVETIGLFDLGASQGIGQEG
jgi:hypothetical protein